MPEGDRAIRSAIGSLACRMAEEVGSYAEGGETLEIRFGSLNLTCFVAARTNLDVDFS